jgi:hypothetical protein
LLSNTDRRRWDEENRQTKTGAEAPVHVVAKANELAIANVHGYFKTETHFGNSWLGPHNKSPLNGFTLIAHAQVECKCIT